MKANNVIDFKTTKVPVEFAGTGIIAEVEISSRTQERLQEIKKQVHKEQEELDLEEAKGYGYIDSLSDEDAADEAEDELHSRLLEKRKELLRLGYDAWLGKGMFDKLYEKIGSLEAMGEAYLRLIDIIADACETSSTVIQKSQNENAAKLQERFAKAKVEKRKRRKERQKQQRQGR